MFVTYLEQDPGQVNNTLHRSDLATYLSRSHQIQPLLGQDSSLIFQKTFTMSKGKFQFAIDRGGTFTDVWARLPDGRERVMKLLSVDPANYPDAPREGIRRILEQVR